MPKVKNQDLTPIGQKQKAKPDPPHATYISKAKNKT
jgi:hypothetical protein